MFWAWRVSIEVRERAFQRLGIYCKVNSLDNMEVELLRTRNKKSKTLTQALGAAICSNLSAGAPQTARPVWRQTNWRGSELERRRIKEKDAVARRISDRKGRRRLIYPHNHCVLPLTDRHCGIIQKASDWMQQNVCCGKL
ncbi:unnamed protein product [Cuscuta campestris]|uniref:Uncharacterized protein n=1 Tax=Cuscuta campestris TaxID=132261 RepID=A0A484MVD0_9ASTE|nr:unnamed protein product [Cuscuta campestris]